MNCKIATSIGLARICAALCICAANCAAEDWRDKPGQYFVPCKNAVSEGFCIYAPPSYDRNKSPSGILIFMHGQGGSEQTKKTLPFKTVSDELNLIIAAPLIGTYSLSNHGQCVEVMDKAIKHVQSNYATVPGRGILTGFSFGGYSQGEFWKKYGAKRGAAFPFNAVYSASSGWRCGAKGGTADIAMIFSSCDGDYANWESGERMTAATADRFESYLKGKACPEIAFICQTERKHSISPEAREIAVAAFKRLDIAFGPIAPESWGELPKIKGILKKANELELGQAMTEINSMSGFANETETLGKLKLLIEKRIASIADCAKKLAEDDPALLEYYGPIFLKRLKGSAQEAELKVLLAKESANISRASKAHKEFAAQFKKFFDPRQPSVGRDKRDFLEKSAKECGEKSMVGLMCANYFRFMK